MRQEPAPEIEGMTPIDEVVDSLRLHDRLRKCRDIVRGWDDATDFSWWAKAFSNLAPPPPEPGSPEKGA
jgi:hypothetical protein